MEDFVPSLCRCRDCARAYWTKRAREKRKQFLRNNPKPPKPILIVKACKVCEVEKPIEEFRFANKAQTVRSPYCKACAVKLTNAYRVTKGRTQDKCARLRTTVAWFYAQLEKQNNLCAICGNPETQKHGNNGSEKIRSLAIDHNHENGKIRGLLCFRCNTALYQLEKNGRDWAHKAVEYLDKYEKET
jgi:hypothetical protein